MSKVKVQEVKSQDGAAFIIYALVCPRTLKVRYVGQTRNDLDARRKGHTPSHFNGAMREWLESMLPDRPICIVLEEGINHIVKLKSSLRRERKGKGQGTRRARVRVWFASIRETAWQKRFRRTIFNETLIESPEADALLVNPPLPWDPGAPENV